MSDPAAARPADLAPLLQGFFADKPMRQRQASPHTIAAYRDTFKLLLQFTAQRIGRQPARLSVADLDAALIGAFLHHLQADRGNSGSTRNARLAAIHSFFGYAAVHTPQHAALIQQVLAVPPQRRDRAIVDYLTPPEAEALIAAPDRTIRLGRRDHVLIQFAIHTGLRVSELTATTIGAVHLGTGAHVRCTGKGRKQRCTPLTKPVVAGLRAWLPERAGQPGDPLFVSTRGTALSRDAVAHLVAKHAAAAAGCPSLAAKTVTPHTLRHTTAMTLLHGGVELSVIAMWLARSRVDRRDPDLPSRRHEHQGTRARPHHTRDRGNFASLPATRRLARLPRQALIASAQLCRTRSGLTPATTTIPTDTRHNTACRISRLMPHAG